jgi:hypothetical protein
MAIRVYGENRKLFVFVSVSLSHIYPILSKHGTLNRPVPGATTGQAKSTNNHAQRIPNPSLFVSRCIAKANKIKWLRLKSQALFSAD